MAQYFSIFLTLSSFITGIFWCLEKFRWKPKRQRQVEALRKETDGNIDGQVLSEIAKPNKWIENTASFFPTLFVIYLLRSFVAEPFQIPSGSMMPNLLIGDFILTNKYAYGIKEPISNKMLIKTSSPKRGEIAVFQYPLEPSVQYVKRVIGEPGDKIVYQVRSKTLLVYPACKKDQVDCVNYSKTPLAISYSKEVPSDVVEVFSFNANNDANFYSKQEYEKANQNKSNLNKYLELNTKEEYYGEHSYDIYTLPVHIYNASNFYQQAGQKEGEWVVPQGHYFMMGDNRDNSADSRFFGFVPEENFVGKVTFIWLSFDKQPNEWPTGIRFSHMGFVN